MVKSRVPRGSFPVYLFRHFSCRMYLLVTMHQCTASQTDRRTDRGTGRQRDDDNSRWYGLAVRSTKMEQISRHSVTLRPIIVSVLVQKLCFTAKDTFVVGG